MMEHYKNFTNRCWPVHPNNTFASCCGAACGVDCQFPKGVAYQISVDKPLLTDGTTQVGGYDVESVVIPLSNNRFLNFKLSKIPKPKPEDFIVSPLVSSQDYMQIGGLGNEPLFEDICSLYLYGAMYHSDLYKKEDIQEIKNYLKGKYLCVVKRLSDGASSTWEKFIEQIPHEVLLTRSFTNRIYQSDKNYLTLVVYKFND